MTRYFSTAQLERWAGLLWGLVLLTLPVTSFRYFPGALGRTVVKPLAFYPLALLAMLLVLLLARGWRRRLPSNSAILLAFLLFGLMTTVVAGLAAPIPLRGAEYWERALRGWSSLLIGLTFFLAAFWMNRSEADLRHSLRWLYAGLGLTILWGLLQALAINTEFIRNVDVDRIQELFSERGTQARRVTGFAYEPAWLADQLLIYSMPWLFAALITHWHLTKQKWLEGALFALAGGLLLFTYSRSGILGGVLTIGIVGLALGRGALRRAANWFGRPLKRAIPGQGTALGLRLGLLLLVAITLLGAQRYLASYDYFANLWRASTDQSLANYLIEINIAPRAAYAVAGYGVYAEQPVSGVGLGASGLHLFRHYPDWALSIPEIARQLAPDSNIVPNPKNLYVRLLAETGLPGFWLFAGFMLSVLGIVRRQWVSGSAVLRYVAAAGLFLWVGLAIRNLTQDSLTFPIMWVGLGMIAGLDPAQAQD
ncbi:MAG: hypothetical protein DWG76_07230 [Chloroflexi bacterium]|nr:hypothetical protein [Chloroflexota bacterium]